MVDCTKKAFLPAYQPLKSFFAKDVEPGKVSDIQLSGGPNKPYYYSLGVNSTCPFVSVQGAGGIQKEFSWGETIMIPPGQTVKLLNASKHKGDIHIQSGRDENNVPRRISFPVKFVFVDEEFDNTIQRIDGFIDTRRCTRAWLNMGDPFTTSDLAFIFGLGYYEIHSSPPTLAASGQNAAWDAIIAVFEPGTTYSNIPLSRSYAGDGLKVDSPIAATFPDYMAIFYRCVDGDQFATLEALQNHLVTLEY